MNMLNHELRRAISQAVEAKAKRVQFRVSDFAPNTETGLWEPKSELVIWNGASDKTMFLEAKNNWEFRAIHDQLHMESGLGFTIAEEIELGRIQANQFEGVLADLVYIEIAKQAEYFRDNGEFVENQLQFTSDMLKRIA
jgi:hypothetical protein